MLLYAKMTVTTPGCRAPTDCEDYKGLHNFTSPVVGTKAGDPLALNLKSNFIHLKHEPGLA